MVIDNFKQTKFGQKNKATPKPCVFIHASSERGTEDPFKILSRLEEKTGRNIKDLRIVIRN